MKSILMTFGVLATAGMLVAADKPADKPAATPAAGSAELPDTKAKVSYGIGMNLGNQWRQQEIDIDLNLMMKGMRDAMSGKETLMTESEMRTVLTSFQQEHRAKQMEKRRLAGEKNKADGQKFLAENKSKPGIKIKPVTVGTNTFELQYEVLAEGSGAPPKSNDIVTVNYKGTLIDGTEFDSSYKRNQAATFAVNGVIKGWTEALQMMKPGAKYKLFIPSELAYGERGSGDKIGANSTLIFEVELVSFTEAPKPPPLPAGQPVVTSDIIKVPSKEELEKGAKVEVIKAEEAEKLRQAQQEKQKAAEKK